MCVFFFFRIHTIQFFFNLFQSEEDKRLQENLNMLVDKIKGPEKHLHLAALESMRDLIRTSTTSMTSVPMPLKFLRNHYGALKEACEKMTDPAPKKLLCSIISVLAMSQDNVEQECLKYCLLAKQKDVGDWGHEYVRWVFIIYLIIPTFRTDLYL